MTADSQGESPIPAPARPRTVALAMPAYNEADGIAGFLSDLDATLDQITDEHWFVVVDDRSTDETATVLAELGPGLTGELIALTNDANSGHGPTVLRAYERALETDAAWILQVDGDGQFEAEDVSVLFDHAESGAAIVTGRRIVRFDPWFRKAVTTALPLMLRLGFGVRRVDINCPFRLYRRDVLPPILAQIPDGALTPHVLMTVLEDRSGHRHEEVQVRHRPRRGKSEVGTTWRSSPSLIIPMKLVRFLKDSLAELIDFRRTL